MGVGEDDEGTTARFSGGGQWCNKKVGCLLV